MEPEPDIELLYPLETVSLPERMHRTRPNLLVKGLDSQEQEVVFRHMGQVLHDKSAGAIRILPEHVYLRRDVPAKVVHVDCLGLEGLERTVLDHSGEDSRPAMA